MTQMNADGYWGKRQRRPHAEARREDFNAEAAEDAEGNLSKTKGNGPGAEKADAAEGHKQDLPLPFLTRFSSFICVHLRNLRIRLCRSVDFR